MNLNRWNNKSKIIYLPTRLMPIFFVVLKQNNYLEKYLNRKFQNENKWFFDQNFKSITIINISKLNWLSLWNTLLWWLSFHNWIGIELNWTELNSNSNLNWIELDIQLNVLIISLISDFFHITNKKITDLK